MSANKDPIYTVTPHVEWGSADGNGGTAGPLKTANTNMDGTGTVLTVFTAQANGSLPRAIRIKAAGTNIASVLRIFVNNGSTNATAANNILVDEIALPATTANAAAPIPLIEIPFNIPLPNGYKINVTLGTTVAAGWFVSANGGDY